MSPVIEAWCIKHHVEIRYTDPSTSGLFRYYAEMYTEDRSGISALSKGDSIGEAILGFTKATENWPTPLNVEQELLDISHSMLQKRAQELRK